MASEAAERPGPVLRGGAAVMVAVAAEGSHGAELCPGAQVRRRAGAASRQGRTGPAAGASPLPASPGRASPYRASLLPKDVPV